MRASPGIRFGPVRPHGNPCRCLESPACGPRRPPGDAVELVVILERDFGIRLKDMETAKAAFASLRSLAEFIMGNRK